MIGGSYGGAIQMATAAVDHRVDALVPMITWNDLTYALDPNNAADRKVPGAFKWQWANGFYLIGESQPITLPNLDPSRWGSLGCVHFVPTPARPSDCSTPGSYPAAATAAMQRYARSVSPVGYLDRVEAPTLLIQGQTDSLFNLNEATATYRTLKEQGTTTKMIWQSWGHSGGQGPANSTSPRATWRPATPDSASSPGSTATSASRSTPTPAPPSPTTATGASGYGGGRRPGRARSPRRSTSPATASSSTTAPRWCAAAANTPTGWSRPAIRRVRWPARSACPTPRRTTPRAPTSAGTPTG